MRAIDDVKDYISTKPLAEGYIRISQDETRLYIQDIDEILEKCFKQNKLPSEIGVSWAKVSKKFDITGYNHFEGRLAYKGEK